ncbi:MAG: molybdopterin-guanine dinucleotide biosynthesis protein B [Thermodesulfobacteriota bacterium]
MTSTVFPPLVCIVGKSDSGKTTLIEKLVPALAGLGLRVGTIKHDVHGFDIDHPGKDSWRHKRAGAAMTVISSPRKLALVKDTDRDHGLDELLAYFDGCDLVLTEGYKRERKPKIEVYRSEAHPEPLCRGDENLIALVSDEDLDLGVPRFGLEDAAGLARFLKDRFHGPALKAVEEGP